jgi:phosphoglycerate dehydrogenase-like enzyme
MGDIGSSFGRLVNAMGGYVIGVRRSKGEKPDFAREVYTTDSLDELLPRAEVVAMSLPNTAETAGLMDEKRLSLMKPGAYLINVGRGSAVVKEALIDALETGHLAGAALDVVYPEPLPPEDKLWQTKNLLITPHVSGLTRMNLSMADKVQEIFKKNLAAYLSGGKMINLVDRKTGYRVKE